MDLEVIRGARSLIYAQLAKKNQIAYERAEAADQLGNEAARIQKEVEARLWRVAMRAVVAEADRMESEGLQ